MRVLVIGDVVGRTGRYCLRDLLEKIKENYNINFVIANGENSAGGTGITRKVVNDIFSYGVDLITTGNHVWDNKDVFNFIDHEKRILRPANYPPESPGKGSRVIKVGDSSLGVINLMGRVFMPALDCPFRTVEKEVARLKEITSNIIIDFHAEATSEKVALGWFLDGQVSAVLGTHTNSRRKNFTRFNCLYQ